MEGDVLPRVFDLSAPNLPLTTSVISLTTDFPGTLLTASAGQGLYEKGYTGDM